MKNLNQPVRLIAVLLVAAGILLTALNVYLRGTVNIALPVLFVMLGAVFCLLVFVFAERWTLAGVFFIPGGLLLAFGLVFLLNTLTGDWNAWAYAWLLLFTGAGAGLAACAGWQGWAQKWVLAGVTAGIVSVTLFGIFGAIAGGKLIVAAAPVLLALAGLALWRVPAEKIFPESILRRFRPAVTAPASAVETAAVQPGADGLAEPLSAREWEVLALIEEGLTNAQIADRLTVAPSTVKTHINNIYAKLGVETRVQAANRARELRGK